MNRIKEVKPLEDYQLLIEFENGEKRIKDSVKIAYGTVCWGDNIDLCADSIYETSSIYEE